MSKFRFAFRRFHSKSRFSLHRVFWIGGSGLCLFALQGWAKNRLPAAGRAPQKAMVSAISGYTRWREVTRQPAAMDPRVAMLCVAQPVTPLPPPTVRGTAGPHRQKWIRVFVNPRGAEAMLKRKNPIFPVGSVIVKQKLAQKSLPKRGGASQPVPPELLTVMIKRAKGYDAANGDWEYLVTDGSGSQTKQSGRLETCQNCHRPYEKTDYVVRSYLPPDVVKALREADQTNRN